ncbi:MAG: cell division protein SepF [Selenomonadaceae bacterium]|nr:cell division protein SepF [Selenomonadaceae bacterium]
MILTDWIKKLTDIIMPLEPPQEEEEEVKETKKVETKIEEPKVAAQEKQAPQPAAQAFQAEQQTAAGGFAQNFGSGTMSFTRHGGMVSTAENGVTSMGGFRYEAYNNGTDEASVRPSLAVVKTPQLTMKIYAPTKFDDQVKQIADDLLKHNAVIVNFEGVSEIDRQRIGDFIIGAVYTIDGQAEMVSSKIVLYVPKGIEYENAVARVPMRRYN